MKGHIEFLDAVLVACAIGVIVLIVLRILCEFYVKYKKWKDL
jgi:hypothetical protein